MDNQGAMVIIPWRLFYCRCKALLCALLVSAGLLYGQCTWDANGLQMVSLWSQNIDMPEKASNVVSDGFLSRYGIIISFTRKVASYVVFCAFQGYAMLSCGTVGK